MQDAIYSSLKAPHCHDGIDAMRSGDVPAPVHLCIKQTNVCIHNSYLCTYRTDDVSRGKEMVMRDYIPKETMAEIIDNLLVMDVKAETFSGDGKPFSYTFFYRDGKPPRQRWQAYPTPKFYPIPLPTPGPRTISITTNSQVWYGRKLPTPKR